MGKDTLLTLTRIKQLELLYRIDQSGFKDNDNYKVKEYDFISNKDLLYSTGNSAECYVAAWREVEFGREWVHVDVWLSPFPVHLKLSQQC